MTPPMNTPDTMSEIVSPRILRLLEVLPQLKHGKHFTMQECIEHENDLRALISAVSQVERLVRALEDALSMLGGPSDGDWSSIRDDDLIKHTIVIGGWKLKQLHEALGNMVGEKS